MRALVICVLFSQILAAATLPLGIESLQKLKSRLTIKVSKINHDIEKTVYRFQNQQIKPHLKKQHSFSGKIKTLHELKRELQARLKFIDQLASAYTHFGPGDQGHKELPAILYKMAVRESQSQEPNFALIEFMTHLSRAVRDLSEPQEDVFHFLEAYMNYSTILDPKDPASFARHVRHYVGAKEMESIPQISIKAELGD